MIAGIAIGLAIPRGSRSVASPHRERDGLARTGPTPIARNVYSPVILKDEFVRRKHLDIVDALERQCRATGENCQLAIAARRAVSEER